MSQLNKHKELLADVLAEESREGFSEALLAHTLHHARQRRQWRRARRAGGVLALLLIAGFVAWQATPRRIEPREIARPQPTPTGYQLVVSQPMAATQLVATQPMVMEAIDTEQETVAQIHTREGGFREVGDDELLTMAEPQIAALIRRGPHQAELVFVPPPETATQ